MKKKNLFMLPCIAAVAIATFVGAKALKSNAGENSLLMENVEAMSAREQGDTYIPIKCYYDINTGYNTEGYICASGTTSYSFKDCDKIDDVKPYTRQSTCIIVKHE